MLSQGLLRMSREQYDAITDRANYSTLKHMQRSPAHYRHAKNNRDDADTTARQIGRVTHLAIYEPELFDAEIAIWAGGRRAGKEWSAFQEEHAGKEIVRECDIESVLRMADAIRSHADVAPHLASGQGEITALWEDPATGEDCKGRLDWIAATGVLLDLKTTRDASPDVFERQAYSLQYHAQAAFYSDGIRAITGVAMPCLIVAAENTPPYAVQVYVLPDETLDAGRALYRRWLHVLSACRKSGKWPSYSSGPLSLNLPRWANHDGVAFASADDMEEA